MKKSTKQLTSVHKAIHILRLFSHDEPELGISEISRRLGIAKSTISRLVQILCEENLLKQNPETKKYHLSLTAFEIGSIVYQEMEIAQAAIPILKKMLEDVNGVIQLAMYDEGEIVYLIKLPEHKDFNIINTMGKRIPSHCTAAGKTLLAFQDEEEIANYINQPLKSFTNKTISSAEDLWNELLKIRKLGYGISRGEFREKISAVAIPIFNDDDEIIAALSVTKPTKLLSNNHIKWLLPEMKKYKRLIEEHLGFNVHQNLR